MAGDHGLDRVCGQEKRARSAGLHGWMALLALVLVACGGGGGGGGGGGSGGGGAPAGPPYIAATLVAFSSAAVTAGALPSGYTSGLDVQVLTAQGGSVITNAVVTLNGSTLAYQSTTQDYLAYGNLNPGDAVNVTVQVNGTAYSVSSHLSASYPTLTAPAPNATLQVANTNLVSWTGSLPDSMSRYLVGVFDTAGNAVWPTGGFTSPAGGATSYLVPANALTPGNLIVFAGVGDPQSFPGAASGSLLITTGFTSEPIVAITTPPPTLTSLRISGTNTDVPPGTNTQLLATGIYSDSSQVDLTSQVNWVSSDTSKATIGSTGQVNALHAGNTTITASLGSVSATFPVVVFQGTQSAPQPLTQALDYQVDYSHSGWVTFGANGPTPPSSPSATWTTTLSGPVSYPLLANGKVYVTAVTAPGNLAGGTDAYALDESTGTVVWGPVHLASSYPVSAAALDIGLMFVVTYDGQLYALDAATGQQRWSVTLPTTSFNTFTAPPTAVNGMVLVAGASVGGDLYAVDGASGALLWKESISSGGESSSPAVDSHGVYVNYYGHSTYMFNFYTGVPVWHLGASGSGATSGQTPVVMNSKLWIVDTAEVPGNLILDIQNGNPLGTFAATTPPAASASSVFYNNNGTLTAVDQASGNVLWSFSGMAGDSGLVTAPLVIDGAVVIVSAGGRVYLLNATTGSLQWTGQTQGASIFTSYGAYYAGSPPPGINAGEGYLVVPAGSTINAWRLIP